MAIHEINIDGAERKICRDCVDKLQMGVNPDKLNKVGHRAVYKMKESKEDEKEVEGTVLGDVGEYVSIVPVVYYCGTVSVLLLDSFLFVGYYYKTSRPYLPVSV